MITSARPSHATLATMSAQMEVVAIIVGKPSEPASSSLPHPETSKASAATTHIAGTMTVLVPIIVLTLVTIFGNECHSQAFDEILSADDCGIATCA